MRTYSIIIPVYNSENSLKPLLEQLSKTLPTLSESYEVILVNDASRDKSWEVIHELAQKYSWVYGINLMRNYGQHNALLCGIRKAQYEFVITMDDDLQHPPEEIRKLIDRIEEGYDVVYGTPQHEQHGFLRDLASQVTKMALQSAMGADTARNVSAFRIFRTQIRDAFKMFQGPFVSIDVLLTWGTTRFSAVSVREEPRTIGVSNYTLTKLITHALNMMTGFSVMPLQIASLIGFGLAIFSVLVLIYVIGRVAIEGTPVPGFAFLASIVGLFSGAQLLALGIIGEYLARMHFRMQDRPSYIIRQEIDNDWHTENAENELEEKVVSQ